MKTLVWDRKARIKAIAPDVWRYVTAASVEERDVELEAAALLDMEIAEIRKLARLHFMLSDQVDRLLAQMPELIRRLTTTTVLEEEVSADRVRGAIRWGPTFGQRAATGLPHLYVTSPARRAHQTPENEVLVAALDAIRNVGRKTGWHRSSAEDVGAGVRDRVAGAERWLRSRVLMAVERRDVTPLTLSKVRSGRARKRYRAAVDVLDLHKDFVRRRRLEAIKTAIEQRALAARRDDRILELTVAFQIERALRDLGWKAELPGLVSGGVLIEAEDGHRKLEVKYQRTPGELSAGSRYREIQSVHDFPGIGGMIPDFVFRVSEEGKNPTWILGEVKGVESPVQDLARSAIRDLLAYRRAFDPVLQEQEGIYGLAIVWGAEVQPSVDSEIAVCTPDTLRTALEKVLGASSGVGSASGPGANSPMSPAAGSPGPG